VNSSVNELQNALSRVLQVIEQSSQGSTKQDAANDTKNSDNNNTSNIIGGQPASTPIQQPANTGFIKFAPAAQQPQANATPADQVMVQIKNAAEAGQSSIKIQLQPADLGKVTVQMVTGSDGKTGVTITADSRQTLSMLQTEARSLESALRNIGLKTDAGGLNFNLRGQGQNSGNTGGQASYTQVAALGNETEEDFGTINALYQVSVQSGLDIRV
jgi:flagellar hook-length control protein FliK